ncbi:MULTISPECIES: TetR/AcrR family transcriptional regulator [Sphingomonas]|uniref:TetR/AcrR family transcriptional regulator n=1 Tax=Sphingomonas adhaesiva TaxID=28212 RepID=A0A2A4I6S1_9SPHN|nr:MULTISPECIES: TetR/AcrR family transcriptional regulator [Sphingomonas]PCG14687.1 TetR/AcrR family transcriptional regulator [Sphingomonas adhaesiva]PZU81688.1 MAG: TetR/AcrR family transcriptional regulator [Sphingomonas sp.]
MATDGPHDRLDERQRRTRAALHAALGRLAERMEYSAIGVSMVAQEAGVGRPTFYRHYTGVDALLVDRLRADLVEQHALAERLVQARTPIRDAHVATSRFALERIASQPRLYRALLDGSAGANAVTLFREQVAGLATMRDVLARAGDGHVARLTVGILSGAVSGFLLAWTEGGLTPPPSVAAELLVDSLRLA